MCNHLLHLLHQRLYRNGDNIYRVFKGAEFIFYSLDPIGAGPDPVRGPEAEPVAASQLAVGLGQFFFSIFPFFHVAPGQSHLN